MSVANATYADDTFEVPTSDEYQKSGTDVLPAPGHYRVKVTSVKKRTDKNGNVILQDDKYPIFGIQRIEIVEPEADRSSHALFQDIRTKPFGRNASGGRKVGASEAADVLLAMDANALNGLESWEEIGQELEAQLKAGTEFTAFVSYTGYDKAYVEATKTPNMTPEETNAMYRKARLNIKNFRGPDGVVRTTATGPSGQPVQAKLKLSAFVSADQDVELGPAGK